MMAPRASKGDVEDRARSASRSRNQVTPASVQSVQDAIRNPWLSRTVRISSAVQNLPVERVHSLLHRSGLDVDAIAVEVGYVDGATLRTLLRQRLGKECAIFAPTCADGL